MCAHIEDRGPVEGVRIVETLNGGSRGEENATALALADGNDYHRTGGSDSHIVSHIGRCATRFKESIQKMDDLVAVLSRGDCEAVQLTENTWNSQS